MDTWFYTHLLLFIKFHVHGVMRYIFFWVGSKPYIPNLPSGTKTPLTIHKLCFSLCLNALVYLTHSGVHTEKCWSSVSTLLSKKSGLTLRCEWRFAILSLTYILAPSFTIHKHHSAAHCLMWKLCSHFLSTWECFGSIPCALGPRWDGYFMYRVPRCKKCFLDLRDRSWVWFQLGYG